MKPWHWLTAIFVALMLAIGIAAYVIAALGEPRFVRPSVIAMINDSTVPIEVQLEIHSSDMSGPLVYSATQTIAVGAAWEVDTGPIASIPTGFRGVAKAFSDNPFHSEYRLRGLVLPFTVRNFTAVPGAIDIRYLRAGAVVQSYDGVTVGADGEVQVTVSQYPPPANYDVVLVASTVAVEGYYTSGTMEIRKK